MKKILCLILTTAIIMTLSGCNNESNIDQPDDSTGSQYGENNQNSTNSAPNQTDSPQNQLKYELTKLTDLYSQFDQQVENSKAKNYPNIIFDEDFKASMPNTDKVYELFFKVPVLSAEECFTVFDNLFNTLFSEVYSDEDKKELYHFTPGADSELGYDNSKPYPHNQPLFYDYKDKLFDGSLSYSQFLADSDKAYLEVHYGGNIHGFSFGKARELYKPVSEGKPIGFWNPSWMFEIINCYNEFSPDISYQLRDKETSLKEAEETIVRFISENKFCGETQLDPYMSQIYIVDMQDGYYGYFFKLAYTYKGVKFFIDTSSSTTGYSGTIYGRDYYRMPGMGFMMESEKPDSLYGFHIAYNIEELEEYDSVISLDKALDILSESFSKNMELHISTGELMYAQYCTNTVSMENKGDFTKPEYKNDIVWKFNAVNTLENMQYEICINAIDGSVNYVQRAA